MTVGFTDRSAKKPQPPSQQPPSAGDILLRVEAAKGQVLALQKHQYLIVEAATYDAEADRRYTEIAGQIADLQRDIEKYQLALARQSHTAKAAVISENAAARRGRLATFEAHAAASVAAIGEICSALATAAEAYSTYLAECREMALSLPGTALPTSPQQFDYVVGGSVLQVGPELAFAVELFRLGLPGGKALTVQTAGLPKSIDSATDARKRLADYLVGHVTREVERMEDREEKALAQ
jgi:hypothetical protein